MYQTKTRPASLNALSAASDDGPRSIVRARLQAESRRLDEERQRCERDLARLEAEVENEAVPPGRHNASEKALKSRVQVLARMNPDLRNPLHEIFGSAQLLHLEGGLSDMQALRVKNILDAGAHLLDQIQHMSNVLTEEIDAPACDRDDTPVPDAIYSLVSRPLRVLIVDDSPLNLEIATTFLRAAKHEVAVATSGAEAITLAAAVDFDVILMDIRMPEMDGLEATQRIRDLPGARGATPVIGLTSLALDDHIEACRAAGMNAHLAKPFRQAALNRAVRLAYQAPAGAPPPAAGAQAPAAAHAPAGWTDVSNSPARMAARRARQAETNVVPFEQDSQFTLQLTHVGYKRGRRRLVDARLSCTPPAGAQKQDLHWLMFINETPDAARSFSATCDLWRWSGSSWRSTAVYGAEFSPDEIFEHGWRYCGPCVDATATLFVS